MFPSFCGAIGLAGWLVMVVVWVVVIAAVVWAVARLFPDHDRATVPAPPRQPRGEDAAPPLAESNTL